MKYLNKIIFTHSANIPYAEISVDGNVHFTGTQGVGKSTVLRALLFFYNADKHRLGIQAGQRPFDEFYFRQSNSYLLYEVMRDNGAYTILVSRYQGRASWRFIDAPYQRDWLIGSDHQVMSDWVKIRERIDKTVAVSARIDSGVLFRDIIFGNTHDHKYTRYALVQSSNYQNIPRSIQNVFLNTKLDADFVKNTIIHSMSDEDLPIDLQTYRRLVTDFEQEYDEIDCWYHQARDGSYPVRQQAQQIAKQGRKIRALDYQLVELWYNLNYAVSESEQQIPILENKVAALKQSIEQERIHENELRAAYDKEKDDLNQKLGGKRSKLEEIAQAHQHFSSMGIETKLRLAARESSLQQEAADKQQLRDHLLKAYASIEEKYIIARRQLENAQQAFRHAQQEAFYRRQSEVQQAREQLESTRTHSRHQLMEAYTHWLHASEELWQHLLAEKHRAEAKLKELCQWHPMAEAMQQIAHQLQEVAAAEKANAAQLQAVKTQLAQLTTTYELKEKTLRQASLRQQEQLEGQHQQLRERLVKVNDLLLHLDGSLYQWLCEHSEGWEETIGKVVDEERILYAQGLAPELTTSTDSLFGVKLQLENIDSTHRTPDDYRAEKQELEAQEQCLQQQLAQLPLALQDEISKLGKQYAALLNPLRQEEMRLRLEAEQLPIKQQNLQNEQHRLAMEEQERIAEERSHRERTYNEAILKVEAENEIRRQKEAKYKQEMDSLDTIFNKGVEALQEQLRQFQQIQASEAIQRNEEFARQSAQLEAQQQAELAGKGVDVRLLEQYRQDLEHLRALLRQIAEERPMVIQYRDAEQRLFAKEPEVRKAIEHLRQQLSELRRRYDERRTRCEQKRTAMEEQQKSLSKSLSERREGLKRCREAIELERLVPDALRTDEKAVKTQLGVLQLLSQLRGTVNQKRETIERLKATVVSFNRNFKPQNASVSIPRPSQTPITSTSQSICKNLSTTTKLKNTVNARANTTKTFSGASPPR